MVGIDTVDPNGAIGVATGARYVIKLVTTETYIFDENLRKQLTSKYEMQKYLKQKEWYKYITNKKAIMTLVCR